MGFGTNFLIRFHSNITVNDQNHVCHNEFLPLDHLSSVLWRAGPLVQQDGDGRRQDNHFPRHRRLGERIPRCFPSQRRQLAPETPGLYRHPGLESCHLQRALRPGMSDPELARRHVTPPKHAHVWCQKSQFEQSQAYTRKQRTFQGSSLFCTFQGLLFTVSKSQTPC